jgi:hypothetical protein
MNTALGASELGVGVMVRAAVPLRQDGSFPDPAVKIGEVLVPAGTEGQIVDIGTYLQEHTVYAVVFNTGRIVGCLGRELVPAQPIDPPIDRHVDSLIDQTSPGGTP